MTLQRLDPWMAAALWTALIYGSIPFVRQIREAVAARWPAELIGVAVVVVVVGATGASVMFLRRRRSKLRFADIAWLAGVALVAVIWISRLMGRPEEAVHFIQYGVLGILLYRALVDRVRDPTVFVAATLVGLLIGTVDEIIQWLVPDRFWDLRDIVLNGSAVALVQIAIWRLHQRPPARVQAMSIRRLCRLAGALVLLMTLCFAATPQRLARVSSLIPLPQRLAKGTDAICEYGFRHTLGDLTVFRSRLSLGQLEESDIDLAESVARRFKASRGSGRERRAYSSPVDNPFGYEFQVHIFSRNRYLHRGRQEEPGSDAHQRLMTVAWRQNMILETVFGHTLEQSSFAWGPPLRKKVQQAQDPGAFFVSRVGSHLITRLSEGRLRVLLLTLFVALVACDLLLARWSRPGAPAE